MRRSKRLSPFAPVRSIVVNGLIVLILAWLALGFGLSGQYAWSTLFTILTLYETYEVITRARGRWQHRAVIKLRTQARRELKRRLAGAKSIILAVPAEKTAITIRRRHPFFATTYRVEVVTLDGDAELDWNLAFAQDTSPVHGQTFYFPQAFHFVEHEVWLVPEEDKRTLLGRMRDNIRRLDMDAAFATVPELQALLHLIHAGVPVEYLGDNPE